MRARPSSDQSPSFWSRWAYLALGTLWAIVAMLVVLNLHVNPDNLRNIEGQSFMHTVYARDPGLWLANFLGIASAIAVAAVELAVRTHRKSDQAEIIAFVLGSLLCVYSLFGVLYGLATIAPIRVMVFVSGVPVARQRERLPKLFQKTHPDPVRLGRLIPRCLGIPVALLPTKQPEPEPEPALKLTVIKADPSNLRVTT